MSQGEIVYQYDTVERNMTPIIGVHILTKSKTNHNDLLVFTQSYIVNAIQKPLTRSLPC